MVFTFTWLLVDVGSWAIAYTVQEAVFPMLCNGYRFGACPKLEGCIAIAKHAATTYYLLPITYYRFATSTMCRQGTCVFFAKKSMS